MGRRSTVGGVTHPLLNPLIVEAVERAATHHLGRAWKHAGFTDLNYRATHPCGIFTGTPFSVFAKLDTSQAGEEQFTAELSGFSLIRSRTAVATPVPVAGGVIVTRTGTLLLSEALPERGAASGQAADARAPGDYAAIGRALAGLHQARGETFGLAEFDGFYGPLPQCNRPVGSGRWADFYAERRVLPVLRLAVDSGYLPAGLARDVERVVAQLPVLHHLREQRAPLRIEVVARPFQCAMLRCHLRCVQRVQHPAVGRHRVALRPGDIEWRPRLQARHYAGQRRAHFVAHGLRRHLVD